jgi:NADPH:quinone reductase-like Zn-dependent oxidoreductase
LIDRQGDFASQMTDYLAGLDRREFDHVIDPFMDVYLRKLVRFTRRFGRYMTCGVAQQSDAMALDDFSSQGLAVHEIFSLMLRKSISLIGNNLGLGADLRHAIRDHQQGHLTVDIDAVFDDSDKMSEFIQRSFMHSGRKGKVVYRYT